MDGVLRSGFRALASTEGLEPECFEKGEVVFRQGEASRDFYLIESGEVELQYDGSIRMRMGEGDFFGEIAAISGRKRTASATCLRDATLLRLSFENFQAHFARNKEFQKDILPKYFSRFFHSKVRSSALFVGTTALQLEGFFSHFHYFELSPGDLLLDSAQDDQLSFILWGEVQVESRKYGQLRQKFCHAGDCFGTSFLLNEDASGYCQFKALTSVGMFRCDSTKLQALLHKFPQMRIYLQNQATQFVI